MVIEDLLLALSYRRRVMEERDNQQVRSSRRHCGSLDWRRRFTWGSVVKRVLDSLQINRPQSSPVR
jgi:hypothetical protein